MFTALKQFIFLENAQDRYIAIKNYAQNSNSWQLNLLTWQILSLLPTNQEKSTLAQSLKMTSVPGSEWAIFSYLLQGEHDATVIRECILNLAKTQNHVLGDKLQILIRSKMHEPEVITAILEYIERTGDERFKDFLRNDGIYSQGQNGLLSEHVGQLLNASLKLGVINLKAKELCFYILKNYTNEGTQGFELYSAVFYIFFSADKHDSPRLNQLKKEIKNPQLLKVFDLCFSLFNPILEGQKELFFETALFQANPLFLGYGLLSEEDLTQLTHSFINKYAQNHPNEVTKTILLLKNPTCTKILAEDKLLGINALDTAVKPQEDITHNTLPKIWSDLCPYYNENFINSVKNPNNYFLWFNDNYHLGFVLLDYNTLFNGQNPQSFAWQGFFEENLQNNIQISINIIFYQIIALRNARPSIEAEIRIIENVKCCLKILPSHDLFIDQIYALCISANSSPKFIKEIYNLIPFTCTSWAFIAIALTAPKIDIQTLNYAILRELNSIRGALLNQNLNKDDYILEVTTRFQSIIIGADKFHVQVTQQTLIALKEIANLIQNILDSIEDAKDEAEDNATDWNGQLILDKPITRWNAILQVCLNQSLSKEELNFYEKILCEGLRVAPHVEKRWVVRALIRIDSDDAIKTILYQALHHIDADFVERTVYELFYSNHPRAKQSLIRCISKNYVSDKMKISIIDHVKNFATQEVLHELKDLMLIRLPEKIELSVQEAVLEISKKSTHALEPSMKEHKFTSAEIDFVIKTFIHDVYLLSVDSRSALRTAEMIFIQSKDWGKEAVDLSPIVNMYCKSVELVLRDTFEPFTDSIMRKGELSQKLELVGYARMAQDKMQSFEDFVAELPIINTISYFSKFKLRKMLRAICLYRPGKRFTLDGPKAFALFLLVTARKSCPYSLGKLFDLYFLTDLELFDFVKRVHSLQDSRNRAVHEGLTWEAREEIDNMRRQAYSIIDMCLKIGIKLKSTVQSESEVRAL